LPSFAPFDRPPVGETHAILADEPALDRLLAHGAERARQVAGETMGTVRQLIGFLS